MSSAARVLESEAVTEVAFQMREAGYDVIIEPRPEDLPFDLAGYRPDIVGRKGDGGVIVEVKVSESRAVVDAYMETADLVKGHPGWRFLLVPANQLRQQTFGEIIGLSSVDQLQRRADAARELLKNGSLAAAFITAWSGVEGVLRRLAVDKAQPASALPTSSLIKQLYSLGVLSRERMQALSELQPIRNSLVHGFSEEGAASSASRVIGILEDLLREQSNEG